MSLLSVVAGGITSLSWQSFLLTTKVMAAQRASRAQSAEHSAADARVAFR